MVRSPLLCIVPPHVLREIARRGSERQREWALATLAASERMRGRRELLGELAPPLPGGKGGRRTVFDAGHGERLPGALVRAEGGAPVRDPAVNEAYDGAGATYDLYREVYGRNSIDGKGMRLVSSVHFGRAYDNAFWEGRQMVYGDGDGKLFNRFTIAVDVIGHELTHGVTQHEAALAYEGEAGALNESFSDVFGILVKQRALRQDAARADWLIGAGLLSRGVKGKALRSLAAPGTAYDDPVLGKDPQPAHMRDYVKTTDDNGGVHLNSGIPNHAFYRAARDLGGFAWEKAGRIWYDALANRLKERATFRQAGEETRKAAGALFGRGGLEEQAVRAAWRAVGIGA